MKLAVLFLIFFLSIPVALAGEEDDEGCSIMNLDDCIVEPIITKFKDFINNFTKDLFSSPANPLLSWFKGLLGHEPNFEPLKPLWNLIRYVISIFYGVLVLWAGFKFLISGADPVTRDSAKTTLKNVLLMIILVQASFLAFSWLAEISSGLTNGILGMMPNDFFQASSNYSVAMTFTFGGFVILLTLFALVNAGLQVMGMYAGVLFFPLGIFLYYFTPTKAFGRLLLSLSIGILFLSFLQSIIFLIASGIGSLTGLAGNHMLVLFIGLATYNAFTTIIVLFLLFKAAVGVIHSDAGRVAKMVVA